MVWFIVGVFLGLFFFLRNILFKQNMEVMEKSQFSEKKSIDSVKDGSRILYYNKPTMVYYIKVIANNEVAYKIGITTQNVYRRFKRDIKDGVHIIELAHQMYQTGEQAYIVEQKLHHDHRQDARWKSKRHMLRSGNSELYSKDILGIDK